ncbi:MAG: hypothetical protein ACI9BD_000858 [Candidatus Marinamargulisbacteria bacterium]|jgi:hypothetical protein
MESKNYLEVTLKLVDETHFATCSAFPKCKGSGKTEDEALQKLGRSIGNFIGRMSGKAISNLILSDKYNAVYLEEGDIEPIQKRHFRLDTNMPLQKNLFFKLKSINDILPKEPKATNDISDLLMMDHEVHDNLTSTPQAMSQGPTPTLLPNLSPHPQKAANEGFMFGFPMSLN